MVNLSIASIFLSSLLGRSPSLTVVGKDSLHLHGSRFSNLLAPVLFSSSRSRIFLSNLRIEKVAASAILLAVDVEECNRIRTSGNVPINLTDGGQDCVYITSVSFENVKVPSDQQAGVVTSETTMPIVVDGVNFTNCAGPKSGGFVISDVKVNISNVFSIGCAATEADVSAGFGVFTGLQKGSEFHHIRINDCEGVAGQASAIQLTGLELTIDDLIVNRSQSKTTLDLPMLSVISCVDVRLLNVMFVPRLNEASELALDCSKTSSVFVQMAYFNNFTGHSIQLEDSYIILTYSCFSQKSLNDCVKLKSGGSDLSMFVFQSYVVFDPQCQFTPSPSIELTNLEKIYGITTLAVFFVFFFVLFIVFIIIIAKSKPAKNVTYGLPIGEEEDTAESIESD